MLHKRWCRFAQRLERIYTKSEEILQLEDWMLKLSEIVAKKFVFFSQRLLGTFLACSFWMVQGDFRLITTRHWRTALQTAFFSSTILLLLSFTGFRLIQEGRYRKLFTTSLVVAVVDHFVHPSHFGGPIGEGIITGISAASLVGMFGLVLSVFS